MELTSDEDDLTTFLQSNEEGGAYVHGVRYDYEKRYEILQNYRAILMSTGQVVSRQLAHISGVSRKFASNFIKALKAGENVLTLEKKRRESHIGMFCLDENDEQFLIEIYDKDHQTTLFEYQERLFQERSKWVAQTTISHWFKKRHKFSGELRMANFVLHHKFSVENTLRTHDFLD